MTEPAAPQPTAPGPAPGDPQHLDPIAWDGLIESLGPASCVVVIDGWIGSALRAHVAAEDIWQEALYLSWRDREQHAWRGTRAYRRWLLEIARNRVHDHARRASALKRGGGAAHALFSELGVEEGATLSGLLPGSSTTPSRVASTNERAAHMRAALATLPSEQATILRMHLFEEREMAPIAAELGIGLAAAWYRFRQGSETYARLLEQAIGVDGSGGP